MRLKEYLKGCDEVVHTTFDPNGPGAVRIHLVPPKKLLPGVPWVVILNGYSIIPLQTTWAMLLREFIIELNKTDGKNLTDDDVETLILNVIANVKKVFTRVEDKYIRDDLAEIIETLKDVAHGVNPRADIGYMTLAKYSKYMSAPHRMDLLISSMTKNGCWNCNQKCIHCYAADEKLGSVEEMSTKDWKKAIDILRKSRVPALTFTGGEPTLRNDLVELVEYSKWFVTRLNTNGIKLTKELCEDLYNASLDSVQITLYSFDESIHNELVGANHFKETVEGIKNAVAAGLDVSINTPLCNLNSDYLSTIKFAEKLGVKYFSCSGLIPTGNATTLASKSKKLTKDEITAVLTLACEYCSSNNLEISFTSPGWVSIEKLKALKLTAPACGAAMSNMAIAPNGEVIPCQSWLFEDGLGNILNTPWKKIWDSKLCKEIRKESSKNLHSCQLKVRRK